MNSLIFLSQCRKKAPLTWREGSPEQYVLNVWEKSRILSKGEH